MRKRKKLLLFLTTLCVLIAIAVALCACGEDEKDDTLFTVTLKSGYNDDFTSVQIAYGANYALPENPFFREGYDFTGWTKEGSTFLLSPGAVSPIYVDTVYVANWQKSDSGSETPGEPEDPDDPGIPEVPENVMLTLSAGFGSETRSITLDKGEEYVLPENPFVREGYIFDGWSYNGETLAPGEKITVDASVTVTAVWHEKSYTVTFVSDGEPFSVISDKKIGEFVNTPAAPDKTGYDFYGWQAVNASGEPTGESVAAEIAINVTGDMTFEAVWRIKSFTVTFVVRGESASVEVDYGDVPVCPIAVPESVNVDLETVAVLVGWDAEIVAATDDVTYTAVYTEQARLYPVAFTENGYVFFAVDGERVTEYEVEYGEALSFTLERAPGVFVDDVTVTAGGKTLVAVDGVYTLPWSSNSVVEVSGWVLAEYDVEFNATNAVYEIISKPETLVYGSAVSFKAKGAEGYSSAAPEVSYGGETLLPVSEQPDEDGWYAFGFEAKYSYDVTIAGIADPEEPAQDAIPITYVDFYGNRYTVYWTEGMGYVGQSTDFPDEIVTTVYEGVNTYYTSSRYDSSYNYALYAFTTEPYAEHNIAGSKAEYDAVLADLILDPFYPSADEENVYYILYYKRESGMVLEFLALQEKSDVAFFIEGESAWRTTFYDTEYTSEGFANLVILSQEDLESKYSFKTGDVVYVKMTLPEGEELPALYNIAYPSKTVEAGYYDINVGGVTEENVYCYKFVFDSIDEIYYFVEEDIYQHTVHIDVMSNAQYHIYSMKGYNFPQDTFFQQGQDMLFYFTPSEQYCDFDRIVKDENGKYVLLIDNILEIEGTYGEVILEAVEDPYGWGEFYAINVRITDIQSDISITKINLPPISFSMPLLLDEYGDYYLDGDKVDGEIGELVVIEIFNGMSLEYRLKDDCGYKIIALGNDSGVNEVISWQYTDTDGSITTYTSANLVITDNSISYTLQYYDFNSQPIKNIVLDTPISFVNFGFGYAAEHLTDKCVTSDSLSNVTLHSESGAQPFVSYLTGFFEVTVRAPLGTVPVIELERSDILSDGFRKYHYVEKTEDGADYNLYTFRIEVDSEVRWYVTSETEVYDITFNYGDNSVVISVAHGTDLENVPGLVKEFIGVNEEGIETLFRIVEWHNASGEVFMIDGRSEVLTAVVTETEYTARFTATNGEERYYESLAAALEAEQDGSGSIYMLYGRTDTSLSGGTYTLGQGIALKLPYAEGGYDRAYGVKGAEGNSPAVFFADTSLGKTSVAIAEGATLEVYGSVSVGGVVGYPQSAYPYQGQTSGAYAVLQLDGVMNVNEGGVIYVNGYIEGAGSLELKAGASSYLPFVVKDYRGGTNSANVYDAGFAPFNIFEMPNVLVSYKINYGATEYAYAMLYAMEQFNEVNVEVIGDEGMIRLGDSVDGYVLKQTRRIENPRYTGSNSSVEPEYEFRTELDIYGGGTDGVMSMNLLGVVTITTKDVSLGIPYTYERITLHDGEYTVYNKYKILPGATLEVASDATMSIVEAVIDGETYRSSIIVYEAGFKEESSQLTNRQQLTYPAMPNGIEESGVLSVNGKLVIRGSFAGTVSGSVEGARIEVRALQSQLTLTAKEAVHLANNSFDVTYEKVLTAMAGETALEANAAYSFTNGSWVRS